MTDRFLALGRYAASTGADAVLFTCSAFGPCIEAVARDLAPKPVLKPNQAMIQQAVARGHRIGLLSTFPRGRVPSMPTGFPGTVTLVPKPAESAWQRSIAAITPSMTAWSCRPRATCATAT